MPARNGLPHRADAERRRFLRDRAVGSTDVDPAAPPREAGGSERPMQCQFGPENGGPSTPPDAARTACVIGTKPIMGWVGPVRIPKPARKRAVFTPDPNSGSRVAETGRRPPAPPFKVIFQLSILSASMNASCGMSTFPNWRIFFFPAFCLSSNLRLRVASPP